MLPRFDYRAARSVREALALWAEQPGSRYLAGGTDLLAQLRGGRRKVARVVDIKRIPELQGIRPTADGEGLSIGASTPLAAIIADPGVQERFPVLARCCEEVGAYPLRHRATMAGNVCNASPAADTAVALLALEATMVATGAAGERRIPAGEFFLGPGRCALADGELLTAIELPGSSAGLDGLYLRLSRRRGMDLATVGALVAFSDAETPRWRIALAAVAPTPLRVREAEELLAREGLEAGLRRAAALAAESCRPITDLRGTAEYRREMVGVLVGRALAAVA